ncbi:MAG: hypothetical protein EOQ65_18710, partial [Mesorhizobium sp.]
MDDDKKSSRKGPGKGGSKPTPRGDKPFRQGARSQGKPFEKRDGARKPYTQRDDRPMAADGERPARDFKRSYKPRAVEGAERGERPFRKGPRPEGKPFEKRDGARKPYTPRGDRPAAAEGERRDFKRSYKPRDGGEGGERGERPFRKGPPRDGKPFDKREGRKPYTPRGDRPMAAEGERAERRFDRPKRDFGDR